MLMKVESRLLIPCLAVLVAQSGITLHLPSLPSIAEDLNAPDHFSALTLSSFLIGMGLTMLLWGKLAVKLGSRRTLIWALALFAVGSLWIALSTDTSTFLICRVAQGTAAGGISVMARTLLRDSYSAQQLPAALSWLSVCFVLALGVAQFGGSLLHAAWGWQAVFLASATSGALAILPTRLLAAATPFKRHRAQPPPSYGSLIRDPGFISPVLAGGLGYGVVVLFGASGPAIFQLHFNWTVLEYGWIGWPISGAYLLGALSVNRLITRCSQQQGLLIGLKCLTGGALLMGAGQVFYPASAALLWLPYCLLLMGQGIVYPLCQSLASQSTPVAGPHTMALTGFIHQAVAACCALISSVLPEGHPAPFTCVCIALSALALSVYSLSVRRSRS
ncbi:Predicted arabinose efflux permease, MFS family [Pseudomonas asturiensis]|uniref:Predicted arabinose efflux permease, MFS family n=1 Tax=Pseudomonas asturiensis TaxID=1190415 RepID=A0A1M7PC11_9PSED|nr:MFS transporter [Pseudomonas asturiensis]SHN14087.1 Predicted arabinose efflux permease, MFS family [Pseudomonas asturiensis]